MESYAEVQRVIFFSLNQCILSLIGIIVDCLLVKFCVTLSKEAKFFLTEYHLNIRTEL